MAAGGSGRGGDGEGGGGEGEGGGGDGELNCDGGGCIDGEGAEGGEGGGMSTTAKSTGIHCSGKAPPRAKERDPELGTSCICAWYRLAISARRLAAQAIGWRRRLGW